MQKSITRAFKAAAVTTTTAGLMLVGLGAASAHVGVSPDSTEAGGYTELTFSVPNESETANTNKIEIELPTETPFTSVRTKPVEGWTAEVVEGELPDPATVGGTTITEAPMKVIWTADDQAHQVSQNQYQTFSLSVGTLPAPDTTVLLPVVQSYTDGSVSDWDDVPAGEGEEVESPAPSFVTTEASEEGHGGSASPEETPVAAETNQEPSSATTDNSNSTLVWLGLGAGVLGLIAGVAALLRTRGAQKS